jgi:hypothetical protein
VNVVSKQPTEIQELLATAGFRTLTAWAIAAKVSASGIFSRRCRGLGPGDLVLIRLTAAAAKPIAAERLRAALAVPVRRTQ